MTSLATRFNPRQEAFITRYVANGGKGAEAAQEAGFGKPYDRSAWRLLQNVEIRREVDRRLAIRANGSEYSLQQWRADVLSDIQLAREAGSHSAVFKGHELLGRHIGALTDTGRVSGEQAAFFASLGAVMQQAFSQQISQQSGSQQVIESGNPQAGLPGS